MVFKTTFCSADVSNNESTITRVYRRRSNDLRLLRYCEMHQYPLGRSFSQSGVIALVMLRISFSTESCVGKVFKMSQILRIKKIRNKMATVVPEISSATGKNSKNLRKLQSRERM